MAAAAAARGCVTDAADEVIMGDDVIVTVDVLWKAVRYSGGMMPASEGSESAAGEDAGLGRDKKKRRAVISCGLGRVQSSKIGVRQSRQSR